MQLINPDLLTYVLQEQLKFIYDTLEEFVLCGYTFFPVKDISQHLKQKSVRNAGSKTNQYEKEYGVKRTCCRTQCAMHFFSFCILVSFLIF